MRQDVMSQEMSGNECERPTETRPLRTLAELESWSSADVRPSLRGSAAPGLCGRRRGPQTLLCHDMMGGYLPQDRGPGAVAAAEPCFTFSHWAYTDVFVYFSHNFVTIPPVGWINAAHANDSLVLGTIITEWDDGAKICEELLSEHERLTKTVEQLCSIAECFGFDGWLVNIENPIKRSLIPSLVTLVRELRDACRARLGPRSRVIWYDSVVAPSGTLKWQDELNALNRPFFDASDGIFLNYCWKAANLSASVELAATVGRTNDVFVGVDVFGRGCLGGGGWNTSEAVTAVAKAAASLALFAPAWTYETLPKTHFQANNRKFWNSLSGHLQCRKITRLPLSVPYFCDGNAEGAFCLSRTSRQPHFLCQASADVESLACEDGALVAHFRAGSSGLTLRLWCLGLGSPSLCLALDASGSGPLRLRPSARADWASVDVARRALSWTDLGTAAVELQVDWPTEEPPTLHIHSLLLK